MKAIAEFAGVETDIELQYYFTAKGYPYAIISSKAEGDGRIIRKELILNEAYGGYRAFYEGCWLLLWRTG